MYFFKNDYSEGCHPQILEALTRTNLKQTVGYGLDPYCEEAARLIRAAADCPDAAVHFLVGGTQTNQTALAAFLRPHQCALAAETGHINVHETGAIEATGHKVVTLPGEDGRLTPELVRAMVAGHPDEHMVKPGLVYLSQSTELGTVYTKTELAALSDCCRELGLYLYVDGARLADALACEGNDVTLPDLARLCDAFYIGGTKCGALFGEALVIVRDELKTDFRYLLKQRGGMLAKGRLLGVQFGELFRDGLYWEVGRHAVSLAQRLQAGLVELGLELQVQSPTNQIFVRFPAGLLPRLSECCAFEVSAPPEGGRAVIRLVTSWATREEDVAGLLAELKAIL